MLTARVYFALNPSWVGGEQICKLVHRNDGKLVLTLERQWPDGHIMKGWVLWRHAEAMH